MQGQIVEYNYDDLARFVKQYLVTALWSSNDESTPEGGEPFDKNFDLENIAPEAMAQSIKECKAFLVKAGNLLEGYDLETAGHDFWLTRNRHGAGFWDGDYEKSIGEKLTELSHSFGEVNPYLGDDGLIYIS